jgi:ABC-2 type transport system ATP-binding protein
LWYKKKELERELESGVLKMLGVDEFLNVSVHKMSGGMKKRLSIGCAVSKNPPILFLDEPMAALDLVCKRSIFEYTFRNCKVIFVNLGGLGAIEGV